MKLSRRGKIVISIVVIGLIVGGIWTGYILKERGEILLPTAPEEEPIEKGKFVSVGYGWSVNNDEAKAVEEAVSSVKMQLNDKSPEFVLLFSTVGYDSEKVLGEVRRLLGDVQVYGGTSCLGVLSKNGFHIGEKGSLALMAISSENITFGVGGASIDDYSSAREAGKAAIWEAISATGKEDSPKIVLMTAAPGEEEEILAGIEEVIGRGVPVFGGSSADNDITGKWKQFSNEHVYSNGITLAVIYTDLKVGWAFEAGYLRTENRGAITKAEGRVIYEIDGRPAAEVYNDWTAGIVAEELETGGSVLRKATFHPLAKVLKKAEKEYTISIHPLSINASDHSLTVFANVEEGDKVLLMHGDWELLLNRCLTTATKALESQDLSEEGVSFAIYDYCAGTMLAIPEEERSKIPALVKTGIGNAPFIGTFTFGEQGHIRGVGNYHNNLANWIIVFTEKKIGE